MAKPIGPRLPSSTSSTWRATASRIASTSSPSGRSVAPWRGAPRRLASRRPRRRRASAARRLDSLATRPMRMSRSDRGIEAGPTSASSRPARLATISSAKNGLPSERAWMLSTTPRPGRWPRIAASCSRCSARVSGRRSSRSTHGKPLELSEPGEQRMAALQVVGAERRDDHDPALLEVPGEERQQVAARGIAPVEVLEDEDERPIAAQAVGEEQDQLEQAGLVQSRPRRSTAPAAGLRHARRPEPGSARSPARPRRAPARRRRADSQGPRAAARGRSTRSTSRNGPYGTPSPPRSTQPPTRTRAPDSPCARSELLDEARLAEARIAADEEDRGHAGLGASKGNVKFGEFGGSTDENGTR